jgi:hypothetical protein
MEINHLIGGSEDEAIATRITVVVLQIPSLGIFIFIATQQ